MAHPYHMHREHQVSHRRVNPMLKDEPPGAKKHNDSGAFSKVTSKTAAETHDDGIVGRSPMGRYARGGKVKGHQTNIAIVMPNRPAAPPASPAGPTAGPPMGPPMGGPGLPPGGPPPGMPMHAKGGRVKKAEGGDVKPVTPGDNLMAEAQRRHDEAIKAGRSSTLTGQLYRLQGSQGRASGGKVIDGEDTKADQKAWSKRAEKNSYFRGGAASGVGREEKAAHIRRRGK